KRARDIENQPDETFEAAPGADGPSQAVLLDAEREQALRDAITALPPRSRQLIDMLFFETPPRPYKDIARRLGMPPGSIGFNRGRCREQLRAQLSKNDCR